MADNAKQQGAQDPQDSDQKKPGPRPGDPVPKEGLDPSQVFDAPPMPPSSGLAGRQAGAGQASDGSGKKGDDDTKPPKDSGPPPPPPGTQVMKDMGYNDEDTRILKEVGDYRFGSIVVDLTNENIEIPSHPETTFDEEVFLILLRGSISLTRDEKWRIIQALPKLSQFQVDELQKILEEEKRKFSDLSPKHLLQLKRLEQKHAQDWKELQSVSVQAKVKEEDQEQVDEIKKNLGL